MGHNIHTTYISEKINKIRWQPSVFNADSTSFITGSWDNEINTIKLWHFVSNEEDPDLYPYTIKAIEFNGDITELQFVNASQFLASSSNGDVVLYKITSSDTDEIDIEEEIAWKGIHRFKSGYSSCCTTFAVNDGDIASVGEDGRINLFNTQRKEVLQTIDEADSCTISCAGFLKHNELITANTRGLLKLWDLRNHTPTSSTAFHMGGHEALAATALAFHPTQRHLVVAGDEDGSFTIWDLRSDTAPVNYVSAHADSVGEIRFHPDRPEQMFSCSGGGELWHWSTNQRQGNSKFDDGHEPSWLLTAGATTENMEVCAMMPKLHYGINSLDLNRDKVLCAADNEAIYLITDVNLYK